ncbi:MAG: hypothetical protein HY077_09640 [Elusimicrobia bacterium]|nr:hypothetical protein [Elusimicrobiota bacterium]
MKTKDVLLAAIIGLSLCGAAVRASAMGESPTLEALKGQERRDSASLATSEQAKTAAGESFTGEKDAGVPPAVAAPGADEERPAPPEGRDPSYTMPGVTPLKGLTIHTPKFDPTGDGRNTTEGPQSPIKPWMVYGSLGIGAAATVGGIFFPPLLFLGGLGLGIGAVLWFIKRKLG